MAGLVMKTSGTMEIWGHDIDRDHRNAKLSIGIVPQEIVFDPFFTPFEVLENQGGMYGVARALRRSEELLRAVHLSDKRDAYARTLSGGMKRRLLIAKAMVHSPPVLELVSDLNAEGVTVVLTTHYLEEAEQLCDRIAIINNGELIANKPTRELVGMMGEKVVEITVERDVTAAPVSEAFIKSEKTGERTIAVTYDKSRVTAGQVLGMVQEQGFVIEDVTTREADLEDVFVQLTSAGQAA
jgi:ABC-2 type transport system ATP-binding protein